ncbi:hypothetical protein Tco_0922379 [Tanacetum coccineum]|uniref:Monodehydroascorbate reductase n=1 Tax=Tanacetum coccineum TaxID=301880 RepID=A0ABQ5CZ68_9ASTR
MTFINANVLSNFVSLQCLSSLLNALLQNTMAEQNIPAQPPTRTDEQIVPRSQWLSIGKSNLLFNAQKIQKNLIFQISVDILSNTNFFQAFTASTNVPAIYLQQFWKTMSYNEKTGIYSCQLDEQWFDLSVDLLRKALAITPVNPAHPFELPPSGDTVIDFVNELGYPEPVEIVSSIRTNYVYQPWRAILCLLNQCLTGKTSGSDKPRHPVLQMLWGIVTQTNVDHAELIWEEFTQGIQTFFSHKASHKASLKNPKKKVTPLLIPYGRFSKVIIYYLASNNNIHRRPDSAVHHTGDDYILGNLKFVPKGESVEVFGMAIPDPLITEAIRQSSYYPMYLKMVAENTKKTPQGSASMQPATKRAIPKKPTTTTPVKQTKPAPPPSKKPTKRKLPQKVRKGKPAFQLVDEEDEAQQESIPQREDDDPDLELAKKLSLETPQEKGEGEGDNADLERAIKLSLDPAFLPQGRAPVGGVTIRDPVSEATPKLHEVVGKGKAVVTEEQVAHSLIDLSKKKRTTDQFILARRDQSPPDSTTGPSSRPDDDTSEKVIHESSSTSDSERTESDTESGTPKGDKVQGEIVTSTVTSGVSIPVSDPEKAHEALAGPDPEPMNEDQTGSDSGKLHVSLAGPNPEHMDDEFLSTAYPKVHENLKLITDERDYTKAREESDSTIPDPSHQTVTSTPPVIAPFTDVTSSEPSLLVTPPPINTEATTITTSLPEITPFIALQLRVARLEQEMSEVKKTDHSADVLASIRSQVPTAVDNYLGTKLDDALLKVLERHTEDLIEKYTTALLAQSSVKNQESEKNPKEINKSQKGHKMKVPWIKKYADKEYGDQFCASGQLNLLESYDQSSKKPRESDSSASKQPPTLPQLMKGMTHDMGDTDNAHIPKGQPLREHNWANAYATTFKVPEENKLQRKNRMNMGSVHQLVDLSNPEGHQIHKNINEPLPLGGPPGQVTIQPQFFFNKDLDYLLTGDKERKIALSISKLKAARYLDFGLEELVPSLWVESEREYDISAVYGITHWWFRRKEFYINKHSESSDREAVRSQMRILSVIRIVWETYSSGLKVIKQRSTLNVQLDAPTNYFKEDYTIVPKPRAVVYRDRNDQRKLMRLNELHKFSDGTLTRVMEKLDQMVKDFHLYEYNKGMETRKWSEDDKRRSKDFITAIEKRLQIKRIYRSLESFTEKNKKILTTG